ncbi:hypothetical protein IJ096_01225 [Candidatus Saccharibacteria bacterium]|nr:hypothetical protein [Candidatus Saccharibacteria bacterium]
MDDFLEEKKSLDELHQELVLELTRLTETKPEQLTFSDADVILYLLDLYFEQIDQRYSYLRQTPRIELLDQIRHNLTSQLHLMDARLDPDEELWARNITLAQQYLDLQNPHTIA